MFELPMAPFGRYLKPTVTFDTLYDIANFHGFPLCNPNECVPIMNGPCMAPAKP